MNTTSASQLEFRGMSAGGGERAESPPLAPDGGATSAGPVWPRDTRRHEIGSPENEAPPAKGPRKAGATGAVEALLNFAEAAQVLGISLRQFRRLVDGGKVAFVKVSERSPRVRPSELQRFLEASAVKYSEVQS
jgi:excisionase family DNA binding protein